jgi:hypothetical protein
MSDFLTFAIPVAIVILFFALNYILGGKNVDRTVVINEYDPPNLSPILVDFLLHGKFTLNGIKAELIDLIIKGNIEAKIVPYQYDSLLGKSDTQLTLVHPVDEAVDPYGAAIVSFFFSNAERNGTVSASYYWRIFSNLDKGISSLQLTMLRHRLYRLSKQERLYRTDPEINTFVTVIGSILLFCGLFIPGLTVPCVLGLLTAAVMLVVASRFNFAHRTTYGTKLYKHAIGFKEYLMKVYKSRYELNNVTIDNKEAFTEYLPYAIVLGVTTKKFIVYQYARNAYSF